MKHSIFLLFIGLFGLDGLQAQVCFPEQREMVDRIMQHAMILTSEEAAGRQPGTQGDDLTRAYIAEQFQTWGLEPMGDAGSYEQFFEVYNPVDYKNSSMQTKKQTLQVAEGFYPVRYSANGRITAKTKRVKYAIEAPELKTRNLRRIKSLDGKIAVLNVSTPDGVHPHSTFKAYSSLQQRIDTLIALGAAGIILINPDQNASDPSPEFTQILDASKVPVVFVTDPEAVQYLKKRNRKNVSIDVKMEERPVPTANIVAFKDNNAPQTIIIGAHHDHLGLGNSASRYRGEPALHRGADDNASGTAALLALAEYFASDTVVKNNNILFIAFAAEEMGLLGSKNWVANPTFNLERVNYMLNMDMIGRMDPESNIVINGSGTSQVWSKLLTVKNCYPIQATLRPSGVGPSDHTSFYNASIPVLHFFTGTHEDYHKPTDTPEKLNYEGIELITRYIQTLVLQTDELGKLDYQQTDTDQSAGGSRMNFSVTLGVIPDYVFGGPGMRLDGVTKGKPAEKAGLKTGDVLLQIGKHRIADIQSYMQALGTFKKGQQVNATYLRDGKERTTEITF